MKNIHILPTDKPSRLWKTWELKLGLHPTITDSLLDKQHLYITSDEEIKEGDWFTDDNNSLKKSYKLLQVQFANAKKIILTTDQDLIKDGVQAIDDEFLEWFVKNSSCEWVKTKLVPINELGSEITVNGYGFDKFIYKPIIPKKESIKCYCGHTTYCDCEPKEEPEEHVECNTCGYIMGILPDNSIYVCSNPECTSYYEYDETDFEEYKQEYEYIGECNGNDGNGCFMDSSGHDCGCLIRKPKQKTLEEAAEKVIEKLEDFDSKRFTKAGFKLGAKWQQERMYSEEEVLEVNNWYLETFLDDSLGLNGKDAEQKVKHLSGKGLTKEVLNYWFKQFKKK